jgi:hypothetical protein
MSRAITCVKLAGNSQNPLKNAVMSSTGVPLAPLRNPGPAILAHGNKPSRENEAPMSKKLPWSVHGLVIPAEVRESTVLINQPER